MTARALLHLLVNGSKALDVVETAHRLGILDDLDRGPVTLRDLSAQTGARPNRMYKFLDCLESMGLVERNQPTEERLDATYRSLEPLAGVVEAALGPASIERDRDRYDWRRIHGKLPDVLRGDLSIESFTWPPSTEQEIASFEASMAAGCPPIAESFAAARAHIFPPGASRWLDVGGGDGTLAAAILPTLASDGSATIRADVFNLPKARELVVERARTMELSDRLGFVGGDFLEDELPTGYDVVSFVRVLHDWDERVARLLIDKAARALAPGGRLVICEEFRTHERLAVQFFWTYFLMGVDACESRLREVDFYLRELGQAGFDDLRVVSGPFDLVVARRC